MTSPDYAPITLRRVAILEQRVEAIYGALHLTLMIVTVALLIALFVVRDDILNAMKGVT